MNHDPWRKARAPNACTDDRAIVLRVQPHGRMDSRMGHALYDRALGFLSDACGEILSHQLSADGCSVYVLFAKAQAAERALSLDLRPVVSYLPPEERPVLSVGREKPDPRALVATSSTIVLKNLDYHVTADMLLRFLQSLPGVRARPIETELSIERDGRFKGVAFAKYLTVSEAAEVMQVLHGSQMAGRTVKAEYKRSGSQQQFGGPDARPMRPNAGVSRPYVGPSTSQATPASAGHGGSAGIGAFGGISGSGGRGGDFSGSSMARQYYGQANSNSNLHAPSTNGGLNSSGPDGGSGFQAASNAGNNAGFPPMIDNTGVQHQQAVSISGHAVSVMSVNPQFSAANSTTGTGSGSRPPSAEMPLMDGTIGSYQRLSGHQIPIGVSDGLSGRPGNVSGGGVDNSGLSAPAGAVNVSGAGNGIGPGYTSYSPSPRSTASYPSRSGSSSTGSGTNTGTPALGPTAHSSMYDDRRPATAGAVLGSVHGAGFITSSLSTGRSDADSIGALNPHSGNGRFDVGGRRGSLTVEVPVVRNNSSAPAGGSTAPNGNSGAAAATGAGALAVPPVELRRMGRTGGSGAPVHYSMLAELITPQATARTAAGGFTARDSRGDTILHWRHSVGPMGSPQALAGPTPRIAQQQLQQQLQQAAPNNSAPASNGGGPAMPGAAAAATPYASYVRGVPVPLPGVSPSRAAASDSRGYQVQSRDSTAEDSSSSMGSATGSALAANSFDSTIGSIGQGGSQPLQMEIGAGAGASGQLQQLAPPEQQHYYPQPPPQSQAMMSGQDSGQGYDQSMQPWQLLQHQQQQQLQQQQQQMAQLMQQQHQQHMIGAPSAQAGGMIMMPQMPMVMQGAPGAPAVGGAGGQLDLNMAAAAVASVAAQLSGTDPSLRMQAAQLQAQLTQFAMQIASMSQANAANGGGAGVGNHAAPGVQLPIMLPSAGGGYFPMQQLQQQQQQLLQGGSAGLGSPALSGYGGSGISGSSEAGNPEAFAPSTSSASSIAGGGSSGGSYDTGQHYNHQHQQQHQHPPVPPLLKSASAAATPGMWRPIIGASEAAAMAAQLPVPSGSYSGSALSAGDAVDAYSTPVAATRQRSHSQPGPSDARLNPAVTSGGSGGSSSGNWQPQLDLNKGPVASGLGSGSWGNSALPAVSGGAQQPSFSAGGVQGGFASGTATGSTSSSSDISELVSKLALADSQPANGNSSGVISNR